MTAFLEGRCSIQLSYGTVLIEVAVVKESPEKTKTLSCTSISHKSKSIAIIMQKLHANIRTSKAENYCILLNTIGLKQAINELSTPLRTKILVPNVSRSV